MESGLKHFFRQISHALADQGTHLSIYGNLPRRGLRSVLKEENLRLNKLEDLREKLSSKTLNLSQKDRIDIAWLGLQDCFKKKFFEDFSSIGREYWEFIYLKKLAEFGKQPPEMQRLEALRKISPPNLNPAHRRHLVKVVREEGAYEVFEKSLKQELEGQLLSDRYQFLSIAAYVFLQCIPKWDILDDLSKPAKTVTRSRTRGQGGRPRSPIIKQRRYLIVTHLGIETTEEVSPLLNELAVREKLYAHLDKEGIPLPESDRYKDFSRWSGLLDHSEDLDARDTLIRDLKRNWRLLPKP